MRIKVSLFILFFLAGLTAGFAVAAVPDEKGGSSQGVESELDQLAKKESDRRQKLGEKGKVITNLDLEKLLGNMKSREKKAVITEVSDEDPTGPEEASGRSEEPDPREELLEQLAEDLRAARQNVETLSNSYMVLELRVNYLRNRLYQESDPFRLEMLEKELNESTTDIAGIRAEEAAARQELERLRSEARRAGMLPGKIDEIVGEIPVTRSSATID